MDWIWLDWVWKMDRRPTLSQRVMRHGIRRRQTLAVIAGSDVAIETGARERIVGVTVAGGVLTARLIGNARIVHCKRTPENISSE